MVSLSRGAFLKAGAATAAAALLAGCSTGNSNSSANSSASESADSYTIKHAYGETTFTSVPQNIAVVQNWINPDAILALGVVPVGAPIVSWGGNDNQSTPWFDQKLQELGGSQPARYDETDGPNYEELAKLEPDAIFCPYGNMDQEIYDKLSEIAPVIPAPEGVGSWAASWQEVVTMAGRMLQKEDEAAEIIENTETTVKNAAAAHENLAGATFIAGAFNTAENTFGAYTSKDTRPRFFTLIGMEQADYVKQNEGDDSTFYTNISAEVLDTVEADAVWAWVEAEDDIQKVKDNSLFANMPALKNDAIVFESDKTAGLALSAASPLSLVWAVNDTAILQNMSNAVTNTRNAA